LTGSVPPRPNSARPCRSKPRLRSWPSWRGAARPRPWPCRAGPRRRRTGRPAAPGRPRARPRQAGALAVHHPARPGQGHLRRTDHRPGRQPGQSGQGQRRPAQADPAARLRGGDLALHPRRNPRMGAAPERLGGLPADAAGRAGHGLGRQLDHRLVFLRPARLDILGVAEPANRWPAISIWARRPSSRRSACGPTWRDHHANGHRTRSKGFAARCRVLPRGDDR
jgi:hypothetical protein